MDTKLATRRFDGKWLVNVPQESSDKVWMPYEEAINDLLPTNWVEKPSSVEIFVGGCIPEFVCGKKDGLIWDGELIQVLGKNGKLIALFDVTCDVYN